MLGLCSSSDAQWAPLAVEHLDDVLRDHAHCEMKAASNALSLASRPPRSMAVARALVALAAEELSHFQRVLGILEARGIPLGAPPVDAYAAELLRAARSAPAYELGSYVDRLLVAALIEARSCERFRCLIESLERAPAERAAPDVLALYRELFPAEARHYRQFVAWAIEEAPGAEAAVRARLDALARLEAGVLARVEASGVRATIHG